MQILAYIRLRLRRGLNLRTIGPNEARIAFDTFVAGSSLMIAWIFVELFVTGLGHNDWSLLALPVLLLLFNAAFGIYSRLKKVHGRVKGAVLLAAVFCSALVAILWGASMPVVVLWAMLTAPPLVVARLLLSLPTSRNRTLVSVAANAQGPVLVIGGAGYIGSHTVEQLLSNGYPVRVLDKLMYGGDSLKDFRNHRDFEFVEGDATDIRKLTSAMRNASAVIHLAGLVGDPACAVDADFTRHTNVVATRMAKDVAQSLGVHRFVFASSCSVYGVSDVEVDELAKLNPVSLYAQTKIDSEIELLSSCPDDFFVTILRFATVFGHSRRPRFDLVANLFTAQAMNEGLITVIGPHQWRPFVHVRDLARAIVAVLQADPGRVQSQIFNVGDARMNMTILQLGETIKRITSEYQPVEISVEDNTQDRRNYAVSFDKINRVLGFRAQTLMDDGIREMVDHFRSHNYQHYREEIYSNVAMTKKALTMDRDPVELMHIYAPLRVS